MTMLLVDTLHNRPIIVKEVGVFPWSYKVTSHGHLYGHTIPKSNVGPGCRFICKHAETPAPSPPTWRDDPQCLLMKGVRAGSDDEDVYLLLDGERPMVKIDTDEPYGELDLLDLIAYLKAHRPDLLQDDPIHLDLPVT